MAQKKRRGFKAPSNYDPSRKPKSKRGAGPQRGYRADAERIRRSEEAQRGRDERDGLDDRDDRDGRNGRVGRDKSNKRNGHDDRHERNGRDSNRSGDRARGSDDRTARSGAGAGRSGDRARGSGADRGGRNLAGRDSTDEPRRAPRNASERGSGSGSGARVFAFDAQGSPKQSAGVSAGREAALPEPTVTRAADAAEEFSSLGVGGNLCRVLGELGADRPFPIQAATIPDIIAGRDVLGRAATGSGKTIAFGAGLVERLLALKASGAFAGDPVAQRGASRPKRGERAERAPRRAVRKPKALILAPTRELALQIDRTVQPLARSVGFFTAQLVGGQPIDPQLHALERGIDIVIGTPGRVQDLVNRRRLDLREVVVTVIDEADHMCELGFLESVQGVLRSTARRGQRLLFSATLDGAVGELVDEFLRDPAAHEAAPAAEGAVEHRVLVVLREDKDRALIELVSRPGRIMVFTRTRAYAERLCGVFVEAGISAVELHGDLSQSRRERNLERFASGRAAVLVATDVAARGIHVDDVDVVLQADPPDEPKAYVHRSGRTGRAGRDGLVITTIARTRQKRTREMLAEAGIEPAFFGDFVPDGAVGVQRAGWIPGETPRREQS